MSTHILLRQIYTDNSTVYILFRALLWRISVRLYNFRTLLDLPSYLRRFILKLDVRKTVNYLLCLVYKLKNNKLVFHLTDVANYTYLFIFSLQRHCL